MKNGFTLIELLAVIVILSVVLLITTLSVGSILNDSEDSLSDTQKKKIEQAAENYYIKEGMNINDMCVSISELIEKGYIENDSIKDPKNNEEMTGYVKITYASNQYSYKYQEESCYACVLVDKDNNKKASLSDVVTCGTESFYVINNAGNNITMLAEKNLVLDISKPIQSSSSGKASFSTTNYWYDSTNKANIVDMNYLNEGKNYPYVFGNYSDNTLYQYVNAYEEYLNKNLKINEVSALLMSYEQAINLGCDPSSHSCSSAPSWLYNTTYWLGSTTDAGGVWSLGSSGYFSASVYSSSAFGVRPVVTISISNFE